MKRLILVRHAKSARDDPSLADRDRPLAPRGERAAAAVAVFLAQEGLQPDRVVCSPAVRTRQTAALLMERLQPRPELDLDEELYLAAGEGLASRLARLGDEVETALLVGHNPGLEELVAWLDPDAGSVRLPTAAVALFTLRVDAWTHLTRGAAGLERVVVPKELV